MNSEQFDIYDEQLNHVGTASRDDAHQHGYWHRTFHCWVFERKQGDIMIAFQQRQASKDTNPLCYDITVAGHLVAGETMKDAVREIKEEVGLHVQFEQLHYLMQVKEQCEGIHHGKPYKDNEVSDVFTLENNKPLQLWTFQAEEVLAVYYAPLKKLQQLFIGEIQELYVEGYIQAQATNQNEKGSTSIPHQATITKAQFVPRDAQYYLNVLEAIATIAYKKAEKE